MPHFFFNTKTRILFCSFFVWFLNDSFYFVLHKRLFGLEVWVCFGRNGRMVIAPIWKVGFLKSKVCRFEPGFFRPGEKKEKIFHAVAFWKEKSVLCFCRPFVERRFFQNLKIWDPVKRKSRSFFAQLKKKKMFVKVFCSFFYYVKKNTLLFKKKKREGKNAGEAIQRGDSVW